MYTLPKLLYDVATSGWLSPYVFIRICNAFSKYWRANELFPKSLYTLPKLLYDVATSGWLSPYVFIRICNAFSRYWRANELFPKHCIHFLNNCMILQQLDDYLHMILLGYIMLSHDIEELMIYFLNHCIHIPKLLYACATKRWLSP